MVTSSFSFSLHSYLRGRQFVVTYKGKQKKVRRIAKRFKLRIGYRRWAYIIVRRGMLMVRYRGLYRQIRLNRGRLQLYLKPKGWRSITRKPRGRRGRRRKRRRRRRRRRRLRRRRRRRYRRRMRRRRQRNVLKFRYRTRWYPVYRRFGYLQTHYGGKWRRVW